MAQKLPFISCEPRTDVDPLANKPAFLLAERGEQMEHERGRRPNNQLHLSGNSFDPRTGIVSKRTDVPYRSGSSKTWLKSREPGERGGAPRARGGVAQAICAALRRVTSTKAAPAREPSLRHEIKRSHPAAVCIRLVPCPTSPRADRCRCFRTTPTGSSQLGAQGHGFSMDWVLETPGFHPSFYAFYFHRMTPAP
jgi:hypothetical protein